MSMLRYTTLLACATFALTACQNNAVDPGQNLPSDASGNIQLLDNCSAPTADHSGIRVELVGTSYSAVTGADGSFHFDDVPAGTYTMKISKAGYVPSELDDVHFQGKEVTVKDLGLRPLPAWSISAMEVRSFPASPAIEIEVAWDLSAIACTDLPQQHIAFYIGDSPDVSNTNFKMVRTITPDWKTTSSIRVPIMAQEMRARGLAKDAELYVIAYPAVDDPNESAAVVLEETSRFVGAGHSAVVKFAAP